MAWQAIGPDATDEQEDDLRAGSRGEHQTERSLRVGEVEDRERERDRRDRVAEEGDDPAEEQKPEVPLPKRTQRAVQRASRLSQ